MTAGAGLFSPSCLTRLFSPWCECQCRVSLAQTDALCSWRTALTRVTAVTRNQVGPERPDGFSSDGLSENKIPNIHLNISWRCLLSYSAFRVLLHCLWLHNKAKLNHRSTTVLSRLCFWNHNGNNNKPKKWDFNRQACLLLVLGNNLSDYILSRLQTSFIDLFVVPLCCWNQVIS